MAFSALTRAQFQSLFDVFIGDATVDPGDMAAGAEVTASVTITGVALGDIVLVGPGVDVHTAGAVFSAAVTAANTVKINFVNATGDHINLASSTWNFVVLRPKSKITSF